MSVVLMLQDLLSQGILSVYLQAVHVISGFRAVKLPGQVIRVVEPLRVSVSNNHMQLTRILPGPGTASGTDSESVG